ncbi:hypothetical protein IQ251_14145 [Saccharopolyspora sp. HNM0983]|uniref:Uncharacterized protein n=1 Tax=Saccharopolyspora montiporae TaxID=2781240 RepID=A0A929G0G3_9PSEU|nr:hypothetical protein [Saccharopolyspora sp. HNM0983]
MTQQGLSEVMQVSLATVQGWESGRRPLVNLPMARFGKLKRVLQLATVSPGHLTVLSEAMQADEILSEVGTTDPAAHPLALVVPNRLLTELLAWPMTGTPPRQLADTKARLDVAKGERDELASVLRTVADRADRGVRGRHASPTGAVPRCRAREVGGLGRADAGRRRASFQRSPRVVTGVGSHEISRDQRRRSR